MLEGCRQLIGDRVLRLAAPTIAFYWHWGWDESERGGGGGGGGLFCSNIMILHRSLSPIFLYSFFFSTIVPLCHRSATLNINIHTHRCMDQLHTPHTLFFSFLHFFLAWSPILESHSFAVYDGSRYNWLLVSPLSLGLRPSRSFTQSWPVSCSFPRSIRYYTRPYTTIMSWLPTI